MRKLLAGFLLTCALAFGAQTFDASSVKSEIDGASTVSWSHTVATCSASHALLLVFLYADFDQTAVNGGTFNSVNLTKVSGGPNDAHASITTFYLFDPDPGTHTISISTNGKDYGGFGRSYCGSSGSIAPSVIGSNVEVTTDGTTSVSGSATTAGNWLVQMRMGASACGVNFNDSWANRSTSGDLTGSSSDLAPNDTSSHTSSWGFLCNARYASVLVQVVPAAVTVRHTSRLLFGPTYHIQMSNQTGFTASPTSGGDTFYTSNASQTGYVAATVGDGKFGGINTNDHIQAYQLVSYNPADISGTVMSTASGTAGVNALSGWGSIGDGHGCGVNDVNFTASADGPPFWWKGNLYYVGRCQSNNDPFQADTAWIIVSPDGKHFCNWGNVQANGGCTSANWSSTGDGVLDSNNSHGFGAIQWFREAPDFTSKISKMGRNYVVMWGADTATGPACPVNLDPFFDCGYTYSMSSFVRAAPDDNSPFHYAHRFRNNCSTPSGFVPMDPACWQHWDGSTWNTDLDAVADITPGGTGTDCGQTHMLFFNRYNGYWYWAGCAMFPIYRSRNFVKGPSEVLDLPPVLPANYNSFGFSGWMLHTLFQFPDGRTRISVTDNRGLALQDPNTPGFIEFILGR